jgi:RHS repeat-associated protein
VNEWGEIQFDKEEPNPALANTGITWVFEPESFIPAAKIQNGTAASIICDTTGTPQEMYDATGKKLWEGVTDIYGRIHTLQGDKSDVPFRNQGQYEDAETGLYYNGFRYYSPEEGAYINQDPIRVEGGLNLYSYVKDANKYADQQGLHSTPVPYGSTDLSQMAQLHRMDNGITGGKNVAVFEYKDNNGDFQYIAAHSDGQHSERRIGKYLDEKGVHPNRVTRIYTELEPCDIPGGKCKNWIAGRFKNAQVTHSFEYGSTRASRRKGVKDMKAEVRKLFKCP